ncbi:MAG: T9SS type A sorting domain-containing protein [Bacteroidales bacterium]
MYKIFFLFLFLLISSYLLKSQNWPQVYGDNIQAHVRGLVEDYDKGLLIAGYIDGSIPSQWGWMIKTDANGNVLWDKKFGSIGSQTFFNQIKKNADNETYIVGSTSNYNEEYDNDPLILKLDPCGEIIWCTVLKSPDDNYCMQMIELNNDHVIGLLKYFDGDLENIRISLVELDENGIPLWIKHMAQEDSTINNEEGWFLNLTSDSTYLISGRCFCNGMRAFYINTDIEGNQIWDIQWEGGSLSTSRETIEFTNDVFYSAGAYADYGPIIPAIYKYNIDGEMIYHKSLLGDTIKGSDTWPLCKINDSLLAIGLEWSEIGSGVDEGISEIFIIDTLGNIKKRRYLVDESKPPRRIIKTFDNKIVTIAGYYMSPNWDIYMWKLNQDLENDTVYSLHLTYDSLCPYQIVSDTVDFNCHLYVNIKEIPLKEEYENIMKLYPNPTDNLLQIELIDKINLSDGIFMIYDILGKEYLKQKIPLGNNHLRINTSHFKSGLYFCLLFDKYGFKDKQKLIIR